MKQALVVVDMQNDYFSGGRMELVHMDEAAINAQRLVRLFRAKRWPIFHIQHVANREGATFFLPETEGVAINQLLQPAAGEPVIEKHFPSSFRDTDLQERLQKQAVETLVICGAMSHMCIDTTVRAAFDLGYGCVVASDGCATRDLAFQGNTVPAAQVHAAFMAALSAPFARVITTEAIEQENQ